jgi:carbamoyl-phosphate synthase large subunit
MKNEQITIGVTGVGAALGQSIVRAALASQRKYRVIGLDIYDEDRAIFPDIEFHRSVHISSKNYKEHMVNFIKKNVVHLLFLGTEREMLGTLAFRDFLESETGVKLALSDERELSIGMDKLRTIELLREEGLPYPRTLLLSNDWADISLFAAEIGYPCVVKGKRAGTPVIVYSEDDLRYWQRAYEDAVLQEFLGRDGSPEYTVGVFYTKEYGLIDTYCMTRQLKYGLTWRGRHHSNPIVEEMAASAVKALAPLGSVNVQLREHKGRPIVHEFNVRCSSTTVFRALSGWNEIDMAVDYFVHGLKPIPNKKIKSGYAIRYFQERWVKD